MQTASVEGRSAARITLVMQNLACGGIQRVGVWLSAGLHSRGYDVTVLTFADTGADFFALPPGVRRVALGIHRARPASLLQVVPSAIMKLWRLRQAIRATAPDVVLSRACQVNVPTLIATRGLGVPVVVTEHGDKPTRGDGVRPGAWRKALAYRLRRLCYPMAHRVVSVASGVDRRFAWLPPTKRSVIRNPVVASAAPMPSQALPASLSPQRPWLVSVGRLTHAKGFDILLDAFARVMASHARWQLAIVGDGELRASLEARAATLGLDEQVVFLGALVDPSPVLRQAQLFVMASRYEGFPNAHGEALACGLPVLATDCPSHPAGDRDPQARGVAELVRHGIDGWLVPPDDTAALASALDALMLDPTRRGALAARALEATERFAASTALDAWDRLLQEASARRARTQAQPLVSPHR